MKNDNETLRPVVWRSLMPNKLSPGLVRLIDQTQLPAKLKYIETDQLEVICKAIKTLQVRGAPAIGITAAMALAADVQQSTDSTTGLLRRLEIAGVKLAATRPTAVNLFWAIERMRTLAESSRHLPPDEFKEQLAAEACRIRDEDAEMCRAIGRHGAALLRDGDTVLTHCNAGALATAEFGTALAPIYTAQHNGINVKVFADETRPLLQGARLTAWELLRNGIDVTLICDNTAAQVMREGGINAVFVGADHIAANGDTANKIGTYGLAQLAKAHHIPFYVCAPSSTIDLQIQDGSGITIEQRPAEEVTMGFGQLTAPRNVRVYSPAFDITPAALITAIVTEKGIIEGDLRAGISAPTPRH